MQKKYYNLMIVPDGVAAPFGIRVQAWVLKALLAAAIVIILALIFFIINYGRIMMQLSATKRLEKENETLRLYKYKVGLLEANMKEARSVVDRIAKIAGIDFQIPELPPDSVLFADLKEEVAHLSPEIDSTPRYIPHGLPLKGFMTRGYSDDTDNAHPGIDIAAAVGSPVQATASGRVTFAGYDSTYGLTVIVDHPGNISTLYGHNSELKVVTGDTVRAGQRISLSGNTGKSTAPHLHYEIREFGKSVNPLKYISNDEVPNKQN